jgi:rSAM/selenodomain-associated transferase 1
MMDTVDRICQLPVDRHLFLAGCSRAEATSFGESNFGKIIQVKIQRGSDLGARMWHAYCEVQKPNDRVVFIGIDSPSVPLDYLSEAFEALSRVPFVLGPAEDGGYFLIGLSKPNFNLFSDISWGSDRVFQETISKLSGMSYQTLPSWYDIDVEKDLTRLAKDLQQNFKGFPKRTAAFLKERNIHG